MVKLGCVKVTGVHTTLKGAACRLNTKTLPSRAPSPPPYLQVGHEPAGQVS